MEKLLQEISWAWLVQVSALMALIMPLNFLGQAQSNTMIYSASVQSVKNLMDSKLDEEPPSKSSEPKKTLVPLSNSIKVGDVKFRYQPKKP
jgi:ABC-type bacteriocin/lantibiotic exporter with double-glycine peptidase domain